MQAWLLRTLSWLPGDSTTSPTAAGVLAAPSGTMPSCRMPRSVKQATLRLSELQHARRSTQQALVAVVVEATCKLCCSAGWHDCPTREPRHQELRKRRQHRQTRCQAVACHARHWDAAGSGQGPRRRVHKECRHCGCVPRCWHAIPAPPETLPTASTACMASLARLIQPE